MPKDVVALKAPTQPVDVIQVFVANKWVTRYKGTSKTKTDINRDSIAEYARTIGLESAVMISVDEDWSALRLKVV